MLGLALAPSFSLAFGPSNKEAALTHAKANFEIIYDLV